MLADFKQTISTYAHQLLTDPQENVSGAMFFSETLALGEISDRPAYCSVGFVIISTFFQSSSLENRMPSDR